STGTLINLLVGFVTGISSGATVVISQYYGRKDADGVQHSVYSGMFLAVFCGAIMMLIGFVFAPDFLRMMNVPEDILGYSITYMRIYFLGLVPMLVYNMGAGILRAVGDSKRPLYFLIAACICNIVLDILFVVVLKMEVFGVGLATTISQVVSCVLTLYMLKKTEDSYQFDIKQMHCQTDTLKRIVALGLPTGIQSCLYSVSNLLIQTTVNGYGTDTVAAFTAFGKIDALFWMMTGAFGTAVMTFVGQNFGAGNIDRVKKGMTQTIIMQALATVVLSTILYFTGGIFYRLFTPDQEVIRIGMEILRFLCPTWIAFVFIEVYSMGIRACGDSLIPMLMTAIGVCGTRMLWIFFGPSGSVLESLFCYPISWILTSTLFIIYYLRMGWLKRSLAQREKMIKAI
ncbi:MAG: MATE family efflux transporter, partial [Erysipelotrichaceae bacterium]|nr:MATE family efflux transporter [Erysipelotrichaceae bacterium]